MRNGNDDDADSFCVRQRRVRNQSLQRRAKGVDEMTVKQRIVSVFTVLLTFGQAEWYNINVFKH